MALLDKGLKALVRAADDRFAQDALLREAKVASLSRSKLIEMPIDDFLGLARSASNDHKLGGVKDLLNKNEPFESLPYLMINRDGSIRGHEGRHRARALKEAGYDTMPVVIRSENIRWSEQGNPSSYDYVDEWPMQLTAERGAASPGFSVAFPVTRDQAAQPYQLKRRRSEV